MGGLALTKKSTQQDLKITRVFDVPRSLVWKAWTDMEHAKHWAGPEGFETRALEHDVRPGGKWRGCLHRIEPERGCGPSAGRDLWQSGQYLEVVEPERLVFTFRWENRSDIPTPETVITILFEEHEGKTTMHFHQSLLANAENRDGHSFGWNSSFDRLEKLLRQEQKRGGHE